METEKAARLAAENMKTIFAYALQRVSNREDAEDLAGEILLAVLENAHTLRCDDAFFGWFWSVASNTVKKYYRQKSREVFAEWDESIPAEGDVADGLLCREEIMLLRRELSILAGEYRECTVAYYFDGLSCGQIGEKFGISTEMVKYYLYKTRRILKEGMRMTREYGEKSYKPVPFHFGIIFDGAFNAEYRNLFARKLPGNILYSAYYTPVTVGELSVELGVAAVYLEDEIDLLMKYDFMTKAPGGKVQTKLCIFTREYEQEMRRLTEKRYTGRLGEILASAREKLPVIHQIGFAGCDLPDNRLLWALYFDLLRKGWNTVDWEPEKRELYAGARGVCYAEDYDHTEEDRPYDTDGFAGFYGLGGGLAACYADFGILPEKNHAGNGLDTLAEALKKGECPVPVLTDAQVGQVYHEILAAETEEMGKLYRELAALAAERMAVHAPGTAADDIPAVINGTLFHRTVGLLGKLAVDSGILLLPEETDTHPYGTYLYCTEETGIWKKGRMSS